MCSSVGAGEAALFVLAIKFDPPTGFRTLLSEPDPEYDWLIPGVLERGDRLILTGGEGKGKSTLLRQIAIQLALGIHPFTLEAIGARSVLFIDLENSRTQIRREMKKIAGGRMPSDEMLQICNWNAGINLNDSAQRIAFSDVLADTLPDVIIGGPTYKMAPDLETETASSQLTSFLDSQRVVLKFALLLESHQPHQVFVDKKAYRPERPFGSSLWLRWPEFGYCLEDGGALRPWRGARDADRSIPLKLKRGDEWPWMVDERECLICGNELGAKQTKYCSPACSATGRKRDERARERML